MTVARLLPVLTILFALAAQPSRGQPSGPNGNIPLPAPELQRRLEREPFNIVDVGHTHGGIMTTEKLTLAFADGTRVDVKWKAAANGGEGWNNSPRKELAAYRVQQLFLDPEDYLVPPVAVRCIPFDTYGPVDPEPEANLPHARCVYGTLSAWLSNVREPETTWDPARFSSDPRFAYHFANLNILTDLIEHKDRRASNFLISTDEHNPQMFSIDNGIILGGEVYNFLTWHFDHIVVGGLPRKSVDRLKHVTPADVAALGVLAELQPDADGILRLVAATPGVDITEGQRTVGDGIQIGLTRSEIDEMNQRLRAILADVDDGKEQAF